MSDAFTGHDDNRDEAARPGDGGPFRVLVAIASFGTKNLPYLEHDGSPGSSHLGSVGLRRLGRRRSAFASLTRGVF
jgi:hypothetical protein